MTQVVGRECECGQPWLPAVGRYGTTEETRCPACVLRDRLVKIERERDELARYRGDVLAGCDIERGGKLYRQVEVVIGPGITVEGRQRAEEAKRT